MNVNPELTVTGDDIAAGASSKLYTSRGFRLITEHLEPEAMGAPRARVVEFCRKGALFALVRINKSMPHRPTVFRCFDKEHPSHTVHTKYTRQCPQYSIVELMNQLHGFAVMRTSWTTACTNTC